MKFFKSTFWAIILIGLLSANTTKAQELEFNHGIGASLLILQQPATDQFESSVASAYAVTYSPRLNVLQLGDDINLSIGTHLSLGFQGEFNSREGGTGSFIFDVPVVAEFNFGHASSLDNDSNFGFFAGGGFEYTSAGVAGGGTASVFGPCLSAGVRFYAFERSYTLRASYMLGINDVDNV